MNVIADLRSRLGLTQAQMGEKLGVSQHAISQYERSERTPADRVMREVARIAEREGLTYTLTDLFPPATPSAEAPSHAA